MLKEPVFTEVGKYTAVLNGEIIWIANHPYASVTSYSNQGVGMPRRSTVFMFWDALQRSQCGSKETTEKH